MLTKTKHYLRLGFILIIITVITGCLSESKVLSPTPEEQPLTLSEFLPIDRKMLFVTGPLKTDPPLVIGLYLEKVEDLTFRYQIDFLENWKKKNTIQGNAQLEEASVSQNKYEISTNNDRVFPALKFRQEQNNCSIEIYVSKRKHFAGNPLFAQVKKKCGKQSEDITPTLHSK